MFTGSRHWARAGVVRRWVDLLVESGATEVLVGDCRTGVDAIVREHCELVGVSYRIFEANWDKHGKAAGPIRNQEMVAANPDFCVGFVRGDKPCRGTRDAVGKARNRHVDTFVVSG